ncbi:MAG: type IV pilus assembly protein PilM [Desulfobacterales bacterium]|jgi:type IV pilus assembly protein PilM|nr:type IV pilus assembly protein PilM [Desulfobacteraceae bacterium]MDY0312925.1 type IV pilus assembly protein PilM [Desulfobacterales bacterium]
MGWKSKKDQLIGLDIGSRAVKAGEIVETRKGNVLRRFAMAEMPPGVIEGGAIRDPSAAARVIQELFRANGLKEQNVAISVGGYSVIVKKISVQTMSEDQLHETIQFEAEQYIPFDISDVNLDFQILGEKEADSGQMDVLLVAAKKEMISDYVHLVQLAGLNPCIIDVDAFALQNVFEINYPDEKESVALIDIGAGKTSLNILKEGSSVFMRDVSLGCSQIDQRIVSVTGCTAQEAERIKRSQETVAISVSDRTEIIAGVVSDWCTEIRRALDFFHSTYPDDQIKRILLSGGGARIGEFRQLLSGETGATVETIDPFRALEIDKGAFDEGFLEQVAPQAAICMGLASRKVDDK